MNATPPFDLADGHRWFAADCFNRAWTLIEKVSRTPEEDEAMISLAHASLCHWREHDDCTSRNLSIGYWQLARIYALVDQAANARHYGQLCLDVSEGDGPFHLGYAHEALARAEKLVGNALATSEHLAAARAFAAQVDDDEQRAMLEKDLDELE
ncbi:MAG: hypothetical protein KDA42_04810 [Planctomycetales bacterium]|nr:hypothetical protein [Planctomycetales bacterium]